MDDQGEHGAVNDVLLKWLSVFTESLVLQPVDTSPGRHAAKVVSHQCQGLGLFIWAIRQIIKKKNFTALSFNERSLKQTLGEGKKFGPSGNDRGSFRACSIILRARLGQSDTPLYFTSIQLSLIAVF